MVFPVSNIEYLKAACDRAGLPAPVEPITVEVLDGGRTGAEVVRLQAQGSSFILKKIPRISWRGQGMGTVNSGEPLLSKHELIHELPSQIRWPVLDVHSEEDGVFDFILMRDVAAGIRDRGAFSKDDTMQLFECMARMHAKFHQSDLLELAPLPLTSGTTNLFTDALLSVARNQKLKPDWITDFLQGFKLLEVFAPLFLDLIGPKLSDAYLQLVADTGWKKQIDELPATFLHGDLRRANISFGQNKMILFDWELASKGPAGCDLQWHCFLHYWGYPPNGVSPGDDCNDLRDAYVGHIQQFLGNRFNPQEFETGWMLGWIRVVCQLAYVLVDPLYPDGGDAKTRERIRLISTRAIHRALAMRESLK